MTLAAYDAIFLVNEQSMQSPQAPSIVSVFAEAPGCRPALGCDSELMSNQPQFEITLTGFGFADGRFLTNSNDTYGGPSVTLIELRAPAKNGWGRGKSRIIQISLINSLSISRL